MQRKGCKRGLTIPTKKWFRDCKAMKALFDIHHPKNRLNTGRGVQTNFFNLLVARYPDYDHKVLWLQTRLLSQLRLRLWNKFAKQKRAGQKVENMTLAPLKNPVRLTMAERKALVGKKRDKGKVIYPKYYEHLKKRSSPKPFGQTKNGLVFGKLSCTSSKNRNLDFNAEFSS